jgi:hypothetical protein
MMRCRSITMASCLRPLLPTRPEYGEFGTGVADVALTNLTNAKREMHLWP